MTIELEWLSKWAIYPPYIKEVEWSMMNIEREKVWVSTKITIVFLIIVITNTNGSTDR